MKNLIIHVQQAFHPFWKRAGNVPRYTDMSKDGFMYFIHGWTEKRMRQDIQVLAKYFLLMKMPIVLLACNLVGELDFCTGKQHLKIIISFFHFPTASCGQKVAVTHWQSWQFDWSIRYIVVSLSLDNVDRLLIHQWLIRVDFHVEMVGLGLVFPKIYKLVPNLSGFHGPLF